MGMEDSKNHVSDIKAVKQAPAPSPLKIQKFKGLDEVVVVDPHQTETQDWEGREENTKPVIKREGVLRQDIGDRNHKQPRLSHAPSKKVIKALRQQAKRRRKNTTIASGNTTALSHLPITTQCELDEVNTETACYRQPTMAEVLASIPGFSIKPRKRSNKKLSAAAQLEQTKEGCVDLETPDSILVNSNLRSLLNKHTFSSLPPLYQYKLLQLLPHVDRTPVQSESMFRLSPSGLNNEFFARACLDWRERLAEGEFTPENQAKIKAEQEKEKSKLDPWKLKHFEPMWGESLQEWPSLPPVNSTVVSTANQTLTSSPPTSTAPPSKPLRSAIKVAKPIPPPPIIRTVGAVTRAVASYREKRQAENNPPTVAPNKRTKSIEPKESALISVNSKVEPVIKKPVINHKPDETLTVDTNLIVQTAPLTSEEETDKANPSVGTISLSHVSSEVPSVSDTEMKLGLLSQGVDPSDEVLHPSPISEDYSVKEDQEIEGPCSSPACTKSEDKIPAAGSELSYGIEESTQPVNEGITAANETSDYIRHSVNIPIENEDSSDAKSSLNDESADETSTLQLRDSNSENCMSPDRTDVANTDDIYADKCEERSLESESIVEISKEDVISEVTETPITSCEKAEVTSLESPTLKSSLPTTDAEKVTSIESSVVEEVSLPADSGSLSYESPLSYEDEVKSAQTVNEVLVPDNPAVLEVEETQISEETQLGFNSENNLSFGVGSEVDESVASVVLNEAMEGRLQLLPEITDPFGPTTETSLPNTDSNILQVEKLGNNTVALNLGVASGEISPSVTTSLSGLSEVGNVQKSLERVEEDWEIIKVDPNEVSGKEQTTYDYQDILYNDPLKDEAAILAAAWDVVGSSTEFKNIQQPVSIIPCKEELEVRLQESSLPAPQWQQYQPAQQKGVSGHVKLELEVTLTPDVDNQVSSSVEQGQQLMKVDTGGAKEGVVVSAPSVTVIPPTTIVCLPPPPVASQAPPPAHTSAHASSSALPYLALTTSTPVRALPTKTVSKGGGGRSGRNSSNKPPPGAVNLERSYQICQAVIQNSPNRDQLRCQLRPPPSLLAKGIRQVMTPARPMRHPRPAPPQHVLLKQVFTSAQGIPVNMAVLPSGHHTSNQQVGEYLMIGQRATARRSNSAPPSNIEVTPAGQLRGRPASVGLHQSSESPSTVTFQDCACSLKAMIACRKCGAFCHNDCIRPSRLCLTCDSR